MRKVSLFMNGKNQAIRLPVDMAYENVSELERSREGDVITLRPVRPGWESLTSIEKADDDFLQDRPSVVNDEGGFSL